MILWMILTLMVAVTTAALTVPLVRRWETGRDARSSTLDVLKDQLGELDAQVAAGSLNVEEADRLRTEVRKRILTEGREGEAPARPLGELARLRLAFGVVAVVALAGTLLYLRLGRPELGRANGAAARSAQSGAQAGAHPGGADVQAVVSELEAKLRQQPNDTQGWGMLGWSYFQTGRFGEAAQAYGRASRLDPSNAEYLSALGESLARAGGGQVTPEAEAAFRKALAVDPGDPRARYFLAVVKDQNGDHKGAMDDWIALLRTAPEGAPWAAEVRGFVERTARQRGIDVSGRLPPVSTVSASAPAAPVPGPTSEQVAQAGQMSDADRQAMINSMVESLAARLKSNPKDLDGWARLMRARMVLGQTAQAQSAYRGALQAFSGDAAGQARVREAAKAVGVPEV